MANGCNILWTIVILPPGVQYPVAFAICTVTSTSCSTLLIGLQHALDEFRETSFSLFEIIFSDFPDDRSWDPEEFAWDHFQPPGINFARQRQKPEDVVPILVAILLEIIDMFSSSRGASALLGFDSSVNHQGDPTSRRLEMKTPGRYSCITFGNCVVCGARFYKVQI